MFDTIYDAPIADSEATNSALRRTTSKPRTDTMLESVREFMDRKKLPTLSAGRSLATPVRRRVLTMTDVRQMVEELAQQKFIKNSEVLRKSYDARIQFLKTELSNAQEEIQRLRQHEENLREQLLVPAPTVVAPAPESKPEQLKIVEIKPPMATKPAPAPEPEITNSGFSALEKAHLRLAESMDKLSNAMLLSLERKAAVAARRR